MKEKYCGHRKTAGLREKVIEGSRVVIVKNSI